MDVVRTMKRCWMRMKMRGEMRDKEQGGKVNVVKSRRGARGGGYKRATTCLKTVCGLQAARNVVVELFVVL